MIVRRMSHLLGALAILALLVTGHAMAEARGNSGVAGHMVICAGGQIVVVPVDDDGVPLGPAHICPDCALSFVAMEPATGGAPGHVVAATVIEWSFGSQCAVGLARAQACARAPPWPA